MTDPRFANTVLYLLTRSAPARPGVTSLLKMLYFADYEHYRRFLAPISGAQYVALERGPVVDGYAELFEQLADEGVLSLHEATVLGRQEKKHEYRPEQEPDVSAFSASELEVLEGVARRYGSETGVDLSEKTHLEGPWQYVWDSYDRGRPIPYALFRWVDNLPEEEDLLEAKRLIESRPDVKDRIAELQSLAS